MSGFIQLLRDSLPEAIGGLAVVAVLALLGVFRRQWLHWIKRKKGWSTPEKDYPPYMPSPERLKAKLDTLHGPSDCPFALVGSIYLDVILRPVATTTLGKDEWSNVDPIECALGGSSLWVGRYLWKLQEKTSYVFSIKGKGNDPFTKEFKRLIVRERRSWLRSKLITGKRNSCTAVTVHLIQQDDEFTTMFTHRGVLAGFDWSDIREQLEETLSRGGVLYLSGLMKTNLHNGLRENLKALQRDALICVDHGRLIPGRFPAAEEALRSAFQQGLVDVYFCTYRELLALCKPGDKCLSYPDDVEVTLEEVANCEELPIITVVRDNDFPGETKAYAIIEKSVYALEGKGGKSLLRDSVGPKNAFNAAFMHYLIHGDREETDSLKDLVIEAGKEALKCWHYARFFRWS